MNESFYKLFKNNINRSWRDKETEFISDVINVKVTTEINYSFLEKVETQLSKLYLSLEELLNFLHDKKN